MSFYVISWYVMFRKEIAAVNQEHTNAGCYGRLLRVAGGGGAAYHAQEI